MAAQMDSMQDALNTLLRRFESRSQSHRSASPPKSPEPRQAEKPTTTSPHYPRLPITFTPTPARRPASKPDMKGNNGYNNGYDMKGLDDKRVGDWKGEEHGYRQGPPPPPAVTTSSPSAVVTTAFRAEDIGYFDPHIDDAYGKGDIVHVGRDVYYRDVRLFLEQAKFIAMVKGPYLIRNSLQICLRGNAQQ